MNGRTLTHFMRCHMPTSQFTRCRLRRTKHRNTHLQEYRHSNKPIRFPNLLAQETANHKQTPNEEHLANTGLGERPVNEWPYETPVFCPFPGKFAEGHLHTGTGEMRPNSKGGQATDCLQAEESTAPATKHEKQKKSKKERKKSRNIFAPIFFCSFCRLWRGASSLVMVVSHGLVGR